MPAATCPACEIAYPATDDYEHCLACGSTTVVRAKTPHKDFKQRAFDAYYTAREIQRLEKIAEA